jgi:hypothetical protein
VRFHDGRHTALTRLCEAGQPDWVIQAQMGVPKPPSKRDKIKTICSWNPEASKNCEREQRHGFDIAVLSL